MLVRFASAFKHVDNLVPILQFLLVVNWPRLHSDGENMRKIFFIRFFFILIRWRGVLSLLFIVLTLN